MHQAQLGIIQQRLGHGSRADIAGASLENASGLIGARHNTFSAYETERRPRGASQHKAAPTSVSGQSRL
jgi:hypothetical protein